MEENKYAAFLGVWKKCKEGPENVFRREQSPSVHPRQPCCPSYQETEAAMSCGNHGFKLAFM